MVAVILHNGILTQHFQYLNLYWTLLTTTILQRLSLQLNVIHNHLIFIIILVLFVVTHVDSQPTYAGQLSCIALMPSIVLQLLHLHQGHHHPCHPCPHHPYHCYFPQLHYVVHCDQSACINTCC